MGSPKLKRVIRLDSITLDKTYFTEEGYLRDFPIVTSVGIFEYANPDGSIRRELRLPEHVFDPESLASYEGKPIIITHNAGAVDKDNVEDEHIGTILSKGIQDGDNVRAKIVIHDTNALKRCGLRELSLGYAQDLIETPGVWEGQPYDAIQTNIRINHLALVDEARAGDQARLNIDSKDGISKLKGGKNMGKTIRHDGVPLTPDQIAEAIRDYQARHGMGQVDGEEELPNKDEFPPESPATPPEENKDEEDPVKMVKDRRDRRDAEGLPKSEEGADIDTLLNYIETLQAKQDFDAACPPINNDEDDGPKEEANQDGEDVPKSPAMNADAADRIVRERIELVRLGDRLNLDGIETMPVETARKAIIKAVNPSMRLDGKSPAYIRAAYDLAKDTLSARKGTNYQRKQMFNGGGIRADSADSTVPSAKKSREEMISRQGNHENGGTK